MGNAAGMGSWGSGVRGWGTGGWHRQRSDLGSQNLLEVGSEHLGWPLGYYAGDSIEFY